MASFAGPNLFTDKLILCLDAGNTNSYPGSGTTWTDMSGKENHGTLTNGPTFSSDDMGSIVFDGSNDYVNASPTTKPASCTFSCWAKSTNVSTRMLFNAGGNGSGPDLFFQTGIISWNTWDANNNPFGDVPSSATDGKYHNYVLVNDSSSNAKLYYDTELLGTATYRSAAGGTSMYIGGTTSTYQWSGSISSFMIYDKLLTESEIKQNYNAYKGRFNI